MGMSEKDLSIQLEPESFWSSWDSRTCSRWRATYQGLTNGAREKDRRRSTVIPIPFLHQVLQLQPYNNLKFGTVGR